ncbi:MAG: site-specific integrase [Syntrophobacteraceae bacterium]|jgi:integrase
MGILYQRGSIWWLKYYKNSKPYYESSKSEKKMVAKKLLERREGEIAQGKLPGVIFEKVKYDELAGDFLTDYRINQRKSIRRAEVSLEHLKGFFAGYRATDISTARVNKYIEGRLEEGAANATINRELAALKRMLRLGAVCTPPKVDRVPAIHLLKENNVRKGFFEHHQFVALRDALPDYLKGVVTVGYRTGWRFSEVIHLRWSQIDRKNGVVNLNPGETKNDDARTIYMDDEVKEVFEKQWEIRKGSPNLYPYVFLNRRGNGKINNFRKAWAKACETAKISEKIFHDFRRTAVRNMTRAEIPEVIARKVSGHRTRDVFDRYNIVNDRDLKLAAQKQQEYLSCQTVTNLVTVTEFPTEKRKGHSS